MGHPAIGAALRSFRRHNRRVEAPLPLFMEQTKRIRNNFIEDNHTSAKAKSESYEPLLRNYTFLLSVGTALLRAR